jgi:hypothetical protein
MIASHRTEHPAHALWLQAASGEGSYYPFSGMPRSRWTHTHPPLSSTSGMPQARIPSNTRGVLTMPRLG